MFQRTPASIVKRTRLSKLEDVFFHMLGKHSYQDVVSALLDHELVGLCGISGLLDKLEDRRLAARNVVRVLAEIWNSIVATTS
jgi:hypothetical protein